MIDYASRTCNQRLFFFFFLVINDNKVGNWTFKKKTCFMVNLTKIELIFYV